MPHWQDSEYGYRPSVNPTNRQLPGLGGKAWGPPVKAEEPSVYDRVVGSMPIPEGDESDWDSPAEVIRNTASWGVTGDSQAATFGKGPNMMLLLAAGAALFGLLKGFRR